MADSAEIQAFTASVVNLTREMSKMLTEMEKTRQATTEDRLEIEEHTQSLMEQLDLEEEQAKNIAQLNKKIKDAKKQMEDLAKAGKQQTAEYGMAARTKALAEKQLGNISKKTGIDIGKLGGETAKTTKAVNLAGAALTYLVGGLLRQRQIMKEQVTANAGLIEGTDLVTGLMNQQAAAWMRGVEPATLGKIMAGNRQMVNAMGGISKTLDVLDPAMDRFFGMTMDLEESMQLAAEQMTRFASRGVKPTREAMLKYTQDVENMARMTGMSAAQIGSYFDSIEEDTDMMHLLRAAREGERESILANQRALVQQNIALGMTTEQAKEAAKMLNKMVGAKPLERMKQAARVRALGAAMGISGAEGAAAAIQAGPRATAAQKEQLRDFSNAAANAADAMRGAGLGSEIFAEQLLDKLDLQEYLGKGSPMSTSLGDVLKEGEKMRGSYVKAADSALVKAEQQFQVLQKILGAIIDGSLIMNMIVTGFKTLWNFFTGGEVSNWISQGFEKTFPKLYMLFSDVIGVLMDGFLGGLQKIISGFAMLIGKIPGLGKAFDWGMELNEEANRKLRSFVTGSGVGYAAEPTRAATPSVPGAAPAAVKPRDGENAMQAQTAAAASSTASGINKQLEKMDENTMFLKTLTESAQKQVALAEKQLAAMTLSEKEKESGDLRRRLIEDGSFMSSYGRHQ